MKSQSVEDIENRLTDLAMENDFHHGFHLLYCPWELLTTAQIAFLSLNPGRAIASSPMKKVHEPSGNSYQIEESTTLSPFTAQYLQLLKLLKLNPDEILTGAYFPFRSERWSDLTTQQINMGLDFSRDFWTDALKRVKVIISSGREVEKRLVSSLQLTEQNRIPSGWGNVSISTYISPETECTLVALPHLSRYRLMANDECKQIVEALLLPVISRLRK